MNDTRSAQHTVIDRIADRIDLAIDLFTLGQYGLEQVPHDESGCGGGGAKRSHREALPPARRGACSRPRPCRGPSVKSS